jgi:shikimate kinase
MNMEKLKGAGMVVFIDRPIDRIAGDIDLSTRPLYVCGFEALYKTYVNRLPLYRKYADYIVDNSGSLENACAAVTAITMEGKL